MTYIKLKDAVKVVQDNLAFSVKAHIIAALRSLPTDDGVTDEMRKALDRQADNMAFILNRVDLPPQWHDKFTRELAEDRKALDTTNAQS